MRKMKPHRDQLAKVANTVPDIMGLMVKQVLRLNIALSMQKETTQSKDIG